MTVHADDIDFGLPAVPEPAQPAEPPEHEPWWPIRLTDLPDQPPVKPTLGQLGDIGFVYPGKRHVFSGPPESAKTLIAYAVLIQVVRSGQTGALIDFEMGAYDARGRLRELGATDQDLNRILYLEPDQPATEQAIQSLVDMKPVLVVFDSALGAFNLEGLDDSSRGDVETLARRYTFPFWRAGIATILIDHVVKDSEARGRYAIGSERKLGIVDVSLGFDTITPISRGTNGLYKITTNKDRGAWLKRGKLADVELVSDPDTHQLTWTIRTPEPPPVDPHERGYFRPTHLMEKVSIHLELHHEPATRNDIAKAVGGTKKYVLDAIQALLIEGFLTETDGPNRSRPVTLTRRYRENDPDCNPQTTSGGSVVRGGSTGGSEPPDEAVVRSGSAVVREPPSVGGSGGSSPYGGDTTEPHHSDHPQEFGGSTHTTAQPQLGWFGDDGDFTASQLAYLDTLDHGDTT